MSSNNPPDGWIVEAGPWAENQSDHDRKAGYQETRDLVYQAKYVEVVSIDKGCGTWPTMARIRVDGVDMCVMHRSGPTDALFETLAVLFGVSTTDIKKPDESR